MSDYVANIQEYKKESVSSLKSELEGVSDFFFSDYRGLTVEQITELRAKLREHNATFRVVKNRFAKIVLNDLKQPKVDDLLKGPTAVCFTKDESGPAVKVLFEMAKDMPLEVKGGIVAGDVYDQEQVKAYSKLPTKSELIATLMRTMQAPVQNVVYVLDAVPTKLVRTLQAVADSKKSE